MSNVLWITLTQTISCNYKIHIDASQQKRGDNHLVPEPVLLPFHELDPNCLTL